MNMTVSTIIQLLLVVFLIVSAIGVSVVKNLFIAVIIFMGYSSIMAIIWVFLAITRLGNYRSCCWGRGKQRFIFPHAEKSTRIKGNKGRLMHEQKTIWQKLKAWVDGEETLLHADDYIAKRGQKKPKQKRKHLDFEELKANKTIYGFLCVLIASVFIAIMLLVVTQLPTFGDPQDPANNEVMERYLEKGIEETGAINFVAGMILDYRAFDTFGEANVLFLAVIGVLLLLQKDEKNRNAIEEREIAEDDLLEHSDYKSILTMGQNF